MNAQEVLDIVVPAMARPLWADEPNVVYVVGISGGKDSTAVLLWLLFVAKIPPDRIIVTFCDTGNEHEWTYAHIELIAQKLHAVVRLEPIFGFFELAYDRKRFPSTKARFCTEWLKIIPSQEYVMQLRLQGKQVISVSGVRADESEERSKLNEWDYSGTMLCVQWRPLIQWTVAQVFALHEQFDFPLNPLYALGALRVGCWPCIMSRKSEIRTIALKFPARIDEIRDQEQRFERDYGRYSSFFPRTTVPPRFRNKPYLLHGVQVMEDILEVYACNLADRKPITRKIGEQPMMVATIDDVVRWSLTGEDAEGSWEDNPEKEPVNCNSGFCE